MWPKPHKQQIKAVESLIRAHTAQVISYLRAFDRPLGLLLNFQVPTLKQGGIKRVLRLRLSPVLWALRASFKPFAFGEVRVVLTDRGGEILGGLGVLAAKGE